jgi:hypothetical protein
MSDTTPTGATTKAEPDHAEFAATLIQIDKGRVHDDAGVRLAEVVEAVNHCGGKGKITITIEVEPLNPETFAEDGVLTVKGKVEAVVPRPQRSAAIFYTKGKRRLVRDDPNRDDPRDRG